MAVAAVLTYSSQYIKTAPTTSELRYLSDPKGTGQTPVQQIGGQNSNLGDKKIAHNIIGGGSCAFNAQGTACHYYRDITQLSAFLGTVTRAASYGPSDNSILATVPSADNRSLQ